MEKMLESVGNGIAMIRYFLWSEQMVRQVIVVGDTLAPHGGTVTSGSNADIVDGKPVSRKGDTVECKEHGQQAISEGDEIVHARRAAGRPARPPRRVWVHARESRHNTFDRIETEPGKAARSPVLARTGATD
jgi:uncharacterized Zn-binding protein involved in type VI secretion